MRMLWICIGLAGCGGALASPEGVPVREAYQGQADLRKLEFGEAPPLAPEKEIPVYYPPEIFAAYVPPQISRTRDIMIGGHWVFLRIKEGGWYPERLEESAAPRGAADESEIRNLKKTIDGPFYRVPHE
jgi:hypothetical protein